MTGKQSPAIAHIRQACCLGLPSRALMPIVAEELRALVPGGNRSVHVGQRGRAARQLLVGHVHAAPHRVDHPAPQALRGPTPASFRDLVMFGKPTGNLRVWWTSGFERSATYAAVFAPYGFKWFLDGIAEPRVLRRHDAARTHRVHRRR